VIGTNTLSLGENCNVKFFYQYGQNNSQTAKVQFFLDRDLNPWNTNGIEIADFALNGTGTNSLGVRTIGLGTASSKLSPGNYALYATITDGTHSRHLYAPEFVTLIPTTLKLSQVTVSQGRASFTVSGAAGLTVVIQSSGDLVTWTGMETNRLGSVPWPFVDSKVVEGQRRFYRSTVQSRASE
jgi:hypothetical protein